jgi:hypothetical protein
MVISEQARISNWSARDLDTEFRIAIAEWHETQRIVEKRHNIAYHGSYFPLSELHIWYFLLPAKSAFKPAHPSKSFL